MKEPDYEEMMQGRVKNLPPRFMSVNVAVEQLLEVEDRLQGGVLTCVRVCICADACVRLCADRAMTFIHLY
jgi:diphthamide biosynthesis methyltransferase